MSREEELDHLRARRDRLAHEIEMTRNDAEHWNRCHPGEEAIDVADLLAEPMGILAGIDRQLGLSDEDK